MPIRIIPRDVIQCYMCGKEIKDYEGVSAFLDFLQIEFMCKECAEKDKEADV